MSVCWDLFLFLCCWTAASFLETVHVRPLSCPCSSLTVWLTASRHMSSSSTTPHKNWKPHQEIILGAASLPAMCLCHLIFQAFAPCCPCLYPGEDSLVCILAVAADKSRAGEITHFNRPVTSVFRTCGGLLLQASEWTDPKVKWQAGISSGRQPVGQGTRLG